MLTWVILGWTAGPGVPDMLVNAESYDEAIAKARAVNPLYCGGHVANDEQG